MKRRVCFVVFVFFMMCIGLLLSSTGVSAQEEVKLNLDGVIQQVLNTPPASSEFSRYELGLNKPIDSFPWSQFPIIRFSTYESINDLRYFRVSATQNLTNLLFFGNKTKQRDLNKEIYQLGFDKARNSVVLSAINHYLKTLELNQNQQVMEKYRTLMANYLKYIDEATLHGQSNPLAYKEAKFNMNKFEIIYVENFQQYQTQIKNFLRFSSGRDVQDNEVNLIFEDDFQDILTKYNLLTQWDSKTVQESINNQLDVKIASCDLQSSKLVKQISDIKRFMPNIECYFNAMKAPEKNLDLEVNCSLSWSWANILNGVNISLSRDNYTKSIDFDAAINTNYKDYSARNVLSDQERLEEEIYLTTSQLVNLVDNLKILQTTLSLTNENITLLEEKNQYLTSMPDTIDKYGELMENTLKAIDLVKTYHKKLNEYAYSQFSMKIYMEQIKY